MAEERRQEFLRADRPFAWRDEHRTEIAKHLVDQLMAGGVKPRRLIAVVWGNEYVRDPAKPAGFFFRKKQGTWNEVQKSDHFEGPLAYKISSEQFVGSMASSLAQRRKDRRVAQHPGNSRSGVERTRTMSAVDHIRSVTLAASRSIGLSESLKKLGELNELLLSELLPSDLN